MILDDNFRLRHADGPSAMTPAVLSAESPVALSAVRFGGGSDFGYRWEEPTEKLF